MINLDMFKNEGRHEEIRQGQTIFKEGDPGNKMYVLVEGSITLSIKGREVERLGPGGVLGEMALIDTGPRSATAVATSACKLVPIDLKRFTLLVQQSPNFALEIMRVISDRLRRMDQRL